MFHLMYLATVTAPHLKMLNEGLGGLRYNKWPNFNQQLTNAKTFMHKIGKLFFRDNSLSAVPSSVIFHGGS